MREGELLKRVCERGRAVGPPVVVGPGDDCAVISTPGGGVLCVTVDQLVEERHFVGPLGSPGGTSVDLAARKAVARSVSDIAAVACTPSWALATVALPPDLAQTAAEELCDRIAHWCGHFGCVLAGGDVAGLPAFGPVVLTVTIAGVPATPRGPVLRSGAAPGDAVWMTGRAGGSFPSGRHLRFEPRLKEARWLAATLGARLKSMIDVSDGLGMDAGRVAAASGLRARLEVPRIPLHADVIDWRAGLSDGEDYELLFVTEPGVELPPRCPDSDVRFTQIGVLEAASPLVLTAPGAGGGGGMGGGGGPGGGAGGGAMSATTCVAVDADGHLHDATTMGWEHGPATRERTRS